MTEYRCNRVPGGIYFFTVNLHDRRSRLLIENIDVLRRGGRRDEKQIAVPYRCLGGVAGSYALPLDIAAGRCGFFMRWRMIKPAFSRHIPAGELRSESRIGRAERGIWQRRFWEHTIRDDRDYATHMDYVHFNPVKHKFCENPAAWPYPSSRAAVAKGLYPAGGAGEATAPETMGERDAAVRSKELRQAQVRCGWK